jgi:carotenoid cleavage dioxygenase-like enzyme
MSADAAGLGQTSDSRPRQGCGVNTNVGFIGGHVHTLVQAGALPIMESAALSDFGGTLQGGFTAHPKYDLGPDKRFKTIKI